MKLVKISAKDVNGIAPLAAQFRVQLKTFKGIKSLPNVEAGRDEILEFLPEE